MTVRAVFMSREGVLCEEGAGIRRADDFRWMPGAIQALKWLHRAHWKLVVVTNQPGIARGLFGPAEYDNVTAWMQAELASHGAPLEAVYHCPHLPDAPLAAWCRQCECRLPQPGLLRRAARDLALDLPSSVVLGHAPEDIAAGRAAGVAACVRIHDDAADPDADYTCASLAEAAYWLLSHEGERRA
jgi:D-glycero-D-manno-heptose 1,7-bisphosphate phosphatase